MEKQEYQTMFELEDHYWWYNGLSHLILTLLQREGVNEKIQLLDAGCGTGGVLHAIRQAYQIDGFGFDFAAEGLALCRQRGLTRLLCASINDMPFWAGQFDVIISLDVLCHRSVRSDVAVLQQFYRLLRPGGLLILNLPAYDRLKSSHDIAVHTAHRFHRGEMRRKLASAGFGRIRLSYRNSFLFPVLALVRILRKSKKSAAAEEASDLSALPQPLNRILSHILYLENRLLRRINFPAGLSLLCLAHKNGKR